MKEVTTEIRRTYWGAAPHTLYTALVWMAAGGLATKGQTTLSIVVFLVGGTLTFPAGELIRRLWLTSPPLSVGNTLPALFMWMAFTIPASYPLIYLACKDNIQVFYPAFTILIGAHYLPFSYGYGMRSFLILSLILVGEGTAFALFIPHTMGFPALVTGFTLLLLSAFHFYLIKKENHEYTRTAHA